MDYEDYEEFEIDEEESVDRPFRLTLLSIVLVMVAFLFVNVYQTRIRETTHNLISEGKCFVTNNYRPCELGIIGPDIIEDGVTDGASISINFSGGIIDATTVWVKDIEINGQIVIERE